jgi:pimeloyl-ACP methyl ester carboxylesterase
MPYVTVGEENSGSIDLYDEDHGSGPPVVVQGDSDQAVPFEQTGQRVPSFVKDAQLVTVSGGPHAIGWTHAEQVTAALLRFTGAHPR